MVSTASEKGLTGQSPTTVHYLFDPLCGWCYGAAPVLERLNAMDEFVVVPSPTGLFADDNARPMDQGFAQYAWSNDQRIAQVTGQQFSERYQEKVLTDYERLFDSGPASRALTAVFMTQPAEEASALKAIQRARYVDGLDITDEAIIAHILASLSLAQAASLFLSGDEALRAAYQSRINRGRSMMMDLRSNGVPALAVDRKGKVRLVTADRLLASFDRLLSTLRAG